METSILNPEALFQKPIRYIVPTFQRPYVWTQDDQWEPLWDDVRNTAENYLEELDRFENDSVKALQSTRPHFLGAVVIQQVNTASREIDRREIIDGQQRMTTLQLLLDATQYVCEELGTIRVRGGTPVNARHKHGSPQTGMVSTTSANVRDGNHVKRHFGSSNCRADCGRQEVIEKHSGTRWTTAWRPTPSRIP